jgi:hypothetical protein
MSTFSKPAAAVGIQWEDLIGRLLLVEPKEFEHSIPTTFGDKDAVRADVTVIDGPDGGTAYPDALIFPGVLISQTRGLIGEKVLGRLGQGVAKPGQKPPWRLDEATPDDESLAVKYLEQRDRKTFAAPAADGKAPWE